MFNIKKAYYSIKEVSEITNLEPHVLRYWENEFPQLRPKKNRAGNRAYRPKEIELIIEIKKLLYEDKYTIEGAKIQLSKKKETNNSDLKEIISDLKNVLNQIEEVKNKLK